MNGDVRQDDRRILTDAFGLSRAEARRPIVPPRWLWLAALAMTLMAPAMFGPMRLNDSHWINYGWAEQFAAAVGHGNLWPRWLAQSHDGLGAPDFYFYGPVSFWLTTSFSLLGIATWPSLLCAATVALWLSGLAMTRYCEGWTRHPALGGALYMSLPYHLLDFGMRGALAEFVAYLSLPLIALAIRERTFAMLAFSYALLVLTHLPTALLASLFLIPILILLHDGRDPGRWLHAAAGLTVGLMLAAPYLLPAITLQRFVAISTMTATPALQASRWTILSPDPHMRDGLLLIGLIGAASMLPAIVLFRYDRWAVYVLAAVVIALGVPSLLWSLPLLARVQFPWRLLVLADFGVALLVARSAWPAERLLLLVVPACALSLVILSLPTSNRAAPSFASLQARHPDVIEYLPAGLSEPYAAYSHRALRLAAAMPEARSAAGWTTLRRNYFPIWQMRCGAHLVPVEAEPATGLLRYRGHGCALEQIRPLSEWLGIASALIGLGLLTTRLAYRKGLLRMFA